ncbi:MAG: hypothetical protein KW788_04135 [Candidatus Doudnabacteria bacterium]|nr:hypothetical protein [Candidatus Doudnabacteria bacterium]
MNKKIVLILFPSLVCAILTGAFTNWKIGSGLFVLLFAGNWAINRKQGE